MTVNYTDGSTGGGGTGGEVTPPVDPDPDPTPGEETTAAFYATASYTGTATYSTQIVNNTSGNLVNPVSEFTAGDIQIYLEKKNNSASNVNGNQVRWYQNDVMHITPLNGATITQIVVDEVSSYNKNVDASTGSATVNGTTLTWTGSANTELTLAAQAQIRFTVMTITYTAGSSTAVSAPQISCTNNMVTITCATDGAQVYYTTDGTEPSNTSNAYSTPFAITENTTVKAIAYSGNEKSAVTTFNALYVGTYKGFQELVARGQGAEGTVDGPITTVYQNGQYLYVVDAQNYPMLVFGSTNNPYVNGQTVSYVKGTYSPYNGLPEVTNPTFGETGTGTAVAPKVITMSQISNDLINTYVQFNDVTLSSATAMSDATGEGVLYSRFTGVTIPSDYDAKYTVTGFVSIFNSNLQIYPTEFVAVVDEDQVANPVINPNGGVVAAGTVVTISCATEGATIYYTTNGDEPTTSSTVYAAPGITVNDAMTIKAIAAKDGMTSSSIVSASFTIKQEPTGNEAQFDFSTPEGLDPAQVRPANGAGTDVPNVNFYDNNVHFVVGNTVAGRTAPRLWAATGAQEGQVDLRLYTDEKFTVYVDKDQYHITGIEFTKIGGDFAMTCTGGTLQTSGNTATWTPTATQGKVALAADDAISEVVFNITGTTRISSATVTYAEGSGILTGVATVGVEEGGEAVYYNLQGVRVQNPERGIYIKVQNGKSTKVVM